MRNLIILRGIAASGKSTFVKDYEQYVVSSDNLRLLYAGIEYDLEGRQRISQKADKKVWNTLFEIVEDRMKDGLLTIVDATHTSEKSIKAYDKLCEKYNYRMTILEFNVDVEEAIRRNNNRIEWKQVPENIIRDMAERMKQPLSEKHQKCMISSEKCGSITGVLIYLNTLSPVKYIMKQDKVVVIGDIHSSYEPLKEYFDNNPYSEKNFYVFLGDLFDRNDQANEVAEFMYDMIQKDNVIVLTGNHEEHIKKILRGEMIGDTNPEFQKTWNILTDENKEKVKAIGRKVRQYFTFEFNGDRYICTHGGISTLYLDATTPTRQLIKGVGNYEDMQKCDEMFTQLETDWHAENDIPEYRHIYSIHGHRNIEGVEIHNTERTFNLCDDVEHGGYLRILEITKDGFTPIKIKNNTFRKKSDKSYTIDILDKLSKSKWVHQKDLGNGIVSFNFTRDAFFKNHFDDINVLARGLFVDSENEKIIGRSYNKFFNCWFEENEANTEHEYGDCSIYALKDKIKFPVRVYKKENGYLGIVSYDYKNEAFFIASKSTNVGDYALHFRNMFMKYYDGLSIINQKTIIDLIRSGKSMIFEVVDEEFDPHIIRNELGEVTKKFVLLDIVNNDFSETYMKYDDLKNVAGELLLPVKQYAHKCYDFDELVAYLKVYNVYDKDDILDNKFPASFAIEGFVMEDANGLRFKFKSAFYCFWKRLRNKIESLKKGNNTVFDEKEQLIKNVLQDKITEYNNVLELREAFWKMKR